MTTKNSSCANNDEISSIFCSESLLQHREVAAKIDPDLLCDREWKSILREATTMELPVYFAVNRHWNIEKSSSVSIRLSWGSRMVIGTSTSKIRRYGHSWSGWESNRYGSSFSEKSSPERSRLSFPTSAQQFGCGHAREFSSFEVFREKLSYRALCVTLKSLQVRKEKFGNKLVLLLLLKVVSE